MRRVQDLDTTPQIKAVTQLVAVTCSSTAPVIYLIDQGDHSDIRNSGPHGPSAPFASFNAAARKLSRPCRAMRSRIFRAGAQASPISKPSPWICSSCRARSAPRRTAATSAKSEQEKPYYLTTPIFYVNAGMKPLAVARWHA